MQLALLYAGDTPERYFWALETLRQEDENMADDDDEAFDDEMQDEEDLHQLQSNDSERELAPEDDDHLPEEELQ